jgi:hypothetical protein
MAISLKEQLQLAQKLKEVSYHAPTFNTTYYKNAYGSQHASGRQQGLRLFYDFYAMEFLWSFLGSGQLPKAERNKGRDYPDDPHSDIIKGKAHRFLPHAAVKTIDDVYEQVTYATADRLIGYLRAAVYQEFRYILGSSDWQNFYSAIVTRYNQKKDITKQDLDELIAAFTSLSYRRLDRGAVVVAMEVLQHCCLILSTAMLNYCWSTCRYSRQEMVRRDFAGAVTPIVGTRGGI